MHHITNKKFLKKEKGSEGELARPARGCDKHRQQLLSHLSRCLVMTKEHSARQEKNYEKVLNFLYEFELFYFLRVGFEVEQSEYPKFRTSGSPRTYWIVSYWIVSDSENAEKKMSGMFYDLSLVLVTFSSGTAGDDIFQRRRQGECKK